MNKNFKSYLTVWAIFFALFNIAVFVSPNEAAGMSKFGGAFWASYIFIVLAFIGQLAVSYFALKEENLEKLFLNISLLRISRTGLILTLVFGTLCMIIPNLPNWAGAVVCLVILGLNAVSLVKGQLAADTVNAVDEKIKVGTAFIKLLTVDAECLMNKTQSPEIKAECKKVYEAVRYSDPMSNAALADTENQIQKLFNAFEAAVDGKSLDDVTALSADLLTALDGRNKKCKVLK